MHKNNKKRQVVVKPAIVNLGPLAFYIHGKNFFEIYERVRDNEAYFIQHFFLVMRSLELLLKSYFLSEGKDRKFVKDKFGHNVDKVLKSALDSGLRDLVEVTNDEIAEIERFNKYYHGKSLEYYDVPTAMLLLTKKNHPDMTILAELARKLINNLKKKTLDAS